MVLFILYPKNNLSFPYKINFNQLPLPHQIEKHETMARTNIKAKLIEKKRFSNKAYTINVELYEHNMAIVDEDSK